MYKVSYLQQVAIEIVISFNVDTPCFLETQETAT